MNKKMNHPTNLLIGIIFTLFFLSFGVIFTINFRSLYYHDIKQLNIEHSSGYEKTVIRENYDALIDFCSPFHRNSFSLPSLSSSPHGIQHFAEVKQIFIFIYGIFLLSTILLSFIIVKKHTKKDYSYLAVSGWTVLLLPFVVALACSINFNRTFEWFHKLFFQNDYWLFDPKVDPVILILPEEFFMHCAYLIIAITIFGSLLLFLLSHLLHTRSNK